MDSQAWEAVFQLTVREEEVRGRARLYRNFATKDRYCEHQEMIVKNARYSTPSSVPQMVKNLPATRETQVWSLGWEDPLEEGMATRSSILAWRIPWTQEPGGLQSTGSQRVGHDRGTNTFTFGGFEVAVGLCIRRVY